MTHPALIERITRSLAYMLRHEPEKFDLELDSHGFGEIDDVVRALRDRLGEPLEVEDLEEAISSGDRARYEIRGSKIRALYGHSIPVEPGDPCQPPEFLYVGIDGGDLQRAQQFGLRGGRRRFLHLALSADDAREAGRRAARQYAILRVFALDAWEDGINFYDRKTLYLAEQIPTHHLEVLEQGNDGYEPRQRDGGDDRESRSGGRGGERGSERNADRGRFERHGHRDSRPRELERAAPPRPPERSRDLERAEPVRAERPRHDRPQFDRSPSERPHVDRPQVDRPRFDRPFEDREQPERAREERPRPQDSRERFEGGRRDREGAPRREFRPEPGPRSEEPREVRRPDPRPEPRRAESRPMPVTQAQRSPSHDDGSFGHGVFEAEAPPPRRPAPPERPKHVAPPPPPPKPVDDASDFGAGL